MLLAFAGLTCVAAWRMLTGCPTCTNIGETAALSIGQPATGPRAGNTLTEPRVDLRSALTILAVGALVGFLTGLFCCAALGLVTYW